MLRAAVYGLAAGLASTVLDDTMVRISVIAGGVAGAIYLHTKIVVPLVRVLHRSLTAWKTLEKLPVQFERIDERFEGVDERFDRLEQRSARIHEPVEAIARELDVQHRAPDRRR